MSRLFVGFRSAHRSLVAPGFEPLAQAGNNRVVSNSSCPRSTPSVDKHHRHTAPPLRHVARYIVSEVMIIVYFGTEQLRKMKRPGVAE